MQYSFPELRTESGVAPHTVHLVANGDLRPAYVPDADAADRAATAKAALFDALGIGVHLCGEVELTGGVE